MNLWGKPKEAEASDARLFKLCKRIERDIDRDRILIDKPGELAGEIYDRVKRLIEREQERRKGEG